MKQGVWISYDLGIKGDYPGLYKWLDIHKAKECGNNVAFVRYDFKSDIVNELTTDLKENVEFKPGDRIYIITQVDKDGETTFVGKHLIGNRKASPWEGYAPIVDTTIDS